MVVEEFGDSVGHHTDGKQVAAKKGSAALALGGETYLNIAPGSAFFPAPLFTIATNFLKTAVKAVCPRLGSSVISTRAPHGVMRYPVTRSHIINDETEPFCSKGLGQQSLQVFTPLDIKENMLVGGGPKNTCTIRH